MEGKRNGKIRAFQQALTLLKKPLDQPAEAWGCGVKGGADGIGGHLLQFTGDDRREQTHKTRLPWDFSNDRRMAQPIGTRAGFRVSNYKVKTLWARGCLAGCWRLDDVAEGASVTVC